MSPSAVASALVDCDIHSSRSTVLRDEVATRTTPHEVTSNGGELNGRVGSLLLPSVRMVFVRYGGEVEVETTPTGERVVATVPLGPMHVRERHHPDTHVYSSGFVLSRRDNTVMRPDPWRGALVVAGDPDRVRQHSAVVVSEPVDHSEERVGQLTDAAALDRACRNAWAMATTLPGDTPHSVVEDLITTLEDYLLTALVLAAAAPPRNNVDFHTKDVRVEALIAWLNEHYASPVTLTQMAGIVGVSVRRMQSAVRAVTGSTPTELLLEIRLRAAHRELLRADPHLASVASIAHGCGISHLGRFSQRYRQRFGCLPSHTLNEGR